MKIKNYIEKAGELLAQRKIGFLSGEAYSKKLMDLVREHNDLFMGSNDDVIDIYRSVKVEAERIIDEGLL